MSGARRPEVLKTPSIRARALCARLGTARGPIVTSCWPRGSPEEEPQLRPRPPLPPQVNCRLTVEDTSVDLGGGGGAGGHLEGRATQDKRQPPSEAAAAAEERELEQVQVQFIALVKLNKWQSFYLAALMYSVINMAFIGHQLLAPACFRSGKEAAAALLVAPHLALVALLVTLLALLRPSHFQPAPRPHLSLVAGLCLVLLGLHLGPWLGSLHLERVQTAACLHELLTQPPIAVLLLYMTPGLVEGWPTLGQVSLLALCAASSMCQLCLVMDAAADYPLAACLTLASLVLGLVRRQRLSRCTLDSAFADAAELVEAKASLEHQRQQQETLLLSVLPVYVAEQVKRNMVKKIESDPEPQHPAAPKGPASPGVDTLVAPDSATSINQHHHHHLAPTDSRFTFQSRQSRSRSITSFPSSVSAQEPRGGGKRTSGGSFLWRLPAAAALLNSAAGASLASAKHQDAPQTAAPEVQVHLYLPAPSSGAGNAAGVAPSHTRRGFNELYIRTYNNVSLLYGDIVGFTKLSTKLSSSQLVRLLNDLFSHFDHLAERHRIMRIKILGDCYYGVAGIPEFAVTGNKSARTAGPNSHHTDNHAINCVNMGLDMIQYIWQLNAERSRRAGQAHLNDPHDDDEAGSCDDAAWPGGELNMRIGIHSGHIHSGVIGLKKWQFDVWSNDVSIAVHCESSGVAGRVQVTQATASQLEGAFALEPAPGCRQDAFLSARDIKTFLIKGRARCLEPPVATPSPVMLQTKQLANNNSSSTSTPASAARQANLRQDVDRIRAATIGTIRQTLLAAQPSEPERQSWRALAFNHHDISAITVHFRDLSLASLYAARPLVCWLAELASSLGLALLGACLLLYLEQTGRPPPDSAASQHLVLIWGPLAALCLLLLLLIISTRHTAASGQSNQGATLLEPEAARAARQEITLTMGQRQSLAGHPSSPLGRLAIRANQLTSLIGARASQVRAAASLGYLALVLLAAVHLTLVSNHHQLTVILLLLASADLSVDLLTYAAKMISLLAILCLQLLLLLLPLLFLQSPASTPASENHQSQPLEALLLLVLVLWVMNAARQVEFINKANFLWRNRINVDHEELEYISGINKVLLENILPSHVVHYYLSKAPDPPATAAAATRSPSPTPYVRMSFSHVRNLGDELYHEQHESVAIMFASIPHFYEFYDESDISKQGLGCIALLNEIICDFDKLLLKNKFSRVEKIKTIGSSYMAAAGLRPCQLSSSQRNSMASQANLSLCGSPGPCAASAPGSPLAGPASPTHRDTTPLADFPANLLQVQSNLEGRKQALSQLKMNLVCIIQFAHSLMSALNGINKQSFQVFKLRVGVHAGPVIAGVIGAQRPFYDIWGDCVNIASRMESLGEIGRIQVEERTAKLLMESSYAENYSIALRGPIDVKGKGGMVTYFVDKRVHGSPAGESFMSTRRPNLTPKNEATRRRQSIAVNHQSDACDAKLNLGAYGSLTDQRLVGKN